MEMLTRFKKPFLSAIAISLIIAAFVMPNKCKAQEEPNEEEVALPQGSNSTPTPPVLIDESDSNSSQTVEDYEAQ